MSQIDFEHRLASLRGGCPARWRRVCAGWTLGTVSQAAGLPFRVFERTWLWQSARVGVCQTIQVVNLCHFRYLKGLKKGVLCGCA